jgi:hypothetical protein
LVLDLPVANGLAALFEIFNLEQSGLVGEYPNNLKPGKLNKTRKSLVAA